jgi:hypothetical protein
MTEIVLMYAATLSVYESRKTMKFRDFTEVIQGMKSNIWGKLPYGTIGFNYEKEGNSEIITFVTVVEQKKGIMSFRIGYREDGEARHHSARRSWMYPTLVFETRYNLSGNQLRKCKVYHLPYNNPKTETIGDVLLSDELPLYSVPFTNISENHEICSGNQANRLRHPMAAIVDFYNSRFNADLNAHVPNSLVGSHTENWNNERIGREMKEIVDHPENYFNQKAKDKLVRVATLHPTGRMVNTEGGQVLITRYEPPQEQEEVYEEDIEEV